MGGAAGLLTVVGRTHIQAVDTKHAEGSRAFFTAKVADYG
jgi:hypothetical protein